MRSEEHQLANEIEHISIEFLGKSCNRTHASEYNKLSQLQSMKENLIGILNTMKQSNNNTDEIEKDLNALYIDLIEVNQAIDAWENYFGQVR
jgi:hypothetical protein